MSDNFATLHGQLDTWPSKERLAQVLLAAGLHVYVGRYSVRVEDCECFSFEQYGGDLGDPIIGADAETTEQMALDGQLVSNALAAAGIKHRFEIYDNERNLASYLHYDWPAG